MNMPMNILIAALLAFASKGAVASDDCQFSPGLVSASAAPVTLEQVQDLPKRVSAQAAVKRLGPAARDVGYGAHVLQWDMADGRIFFVSFAGDTCARSLNSGILSQPQG